MWMTWATTATGLLADRLPLLSTLPNEQLYYLLSCFAFSRGLLLFSPRYPWFSVCSALEAYFYLKAMAQ